MVRGLFAAVTVMSSSPAFAQDVDGDRMAECYAAYSTLVMMGEVLKLPDADTAAAEVKRSKAETMAIAIYKLEGLSEELAREQLEERVQFMRSEMRELTNSRGTYSIEDIRKMASACDALVDG